MKLFKKENRTKEIILLTVLVILFNFIVPNYAQADFGGIIFNPFAQLIRGICDAIISLLEDCFVGYSGGAFSFNNNTFNMEGTAIYYSPAIIFANKVPLLSINFITDEEEQNIEYKVINDWGTVDKEKFKIMKVTREGMVVEYQFNESTKYEFVAWKNEYPKTTYSYKYTDSNGNVKTTIPVNQAWYGEAHVDNKFWSTVDSYAMSGGAGAVIGTGIGAAIAGAMRTGRLDCIRSRCISSISRSYWRWRWNIICS